MVIVDTREKPRAIVRILAEFDRQGVEYVRKKLDFADYADPARIPGIVVDRKQSLLEVVTNVTTDRARFVREIDRCHAAGCRMVVLIEHGNTIRRLEDVIGWKNPRLKESRYAVSGERLYKIMKAMSTYYGIEWQFCNKQSTGRRILQILGGDGNE